MKTILGITAIEAKSLVQDKLTLDKEEQNKNAIKAFNLIKQKIEEAPRYIRCSMDHEGVDRA